MTNVGNVTMTLSDKERFILHLAMNMNPKGTSDETHVIIKHIRDHRCRSLPPNIIKDLLVEIRDELMLSREMWNEPYM